MSQGREGAIKFDNTTRWRQIKKKKETAHTQVNMVHCSLFIW